LLLEIGYLVCHYKKTRLITGRFLRSSASTASHLVRNAQAPLGAEKGIGSGNMETLLLVFASLAALAFGVLSAYGACNMLFALFEIHAAQQRAKAPANVSAQPVSV
jgi:hypothetical protein